MNMEAVEGCFPFPSLNSLIDREQLFTESLNIAIFNGLLYDSKLKKLYISSADAIFLP